jgi:1-acyl-sn-glycerol-3-phosphate acyltransferase
MATDGEHHTTELALREEPEDAGQALADPAETFREQLPGLEPDRDVSDWGRSQRVSGLADATLLRFLYHYWFRVEAEGVENVPGEGGALLVANRAGVLPADGLMIAKAVRDEHPGARPVHIATGRTFADFPGLGMAVTKLGAVGAHPANLHRLLFDERALVLVFPEGSRGVHKPLRWRYRLRRFDAIPFVQSALRAGVPIVPVALVGAEEAVPRFGSLPRVPGMPRLPITSGLPLPAKFRLRFLQPVRTDEMGAAAARDGVLAQEVAEQIRGLVQENLFEMVAQRRSVWLG